jgi:hypothetical protein
MKSELIRMVVNSLIRNRERKTARYVGSRFTRDVAFQFRMGAGFVGDVNRTHPAGIESALIDSTLPPLNYGVAVLADAAAPNGVRGIQTTDNAITAVYGITVRPFPLQQASATNYGAVALGAGSQIPPTSGVIDVMKSGYIMVKLGGAAAAFKGSPVYLYYGVSTGTHIQGGFEAAAGANLLGPLDTTGTRIYFNGPADSNGIVELVFNP